MAGQDPSTALLKRPKNAVVAYIKEECLKNPNPKCLMDTLDTCLDPARPIDDLDSITLCKWLIAGSPNYELFAKKVREYDSSVICGLVWTAKFVAYRCRTCGISPCMSLCSDCFQAGNHENHDYNMFRSQAGGACDCGDISVMKSTGFCPRHGPEHQQVATNPPVELLCVAEAMMPRIFMRLIFYLRDTCDPGISSCALNLADAEQYLGFLHSLSDMGAAMRRVMTCALVNEAQYKLHLKGVGGSSYCDNSNAKFEQAVQSLSCPQNCKGFNSAGLVNCNRSSSSEEGKERLESYKTMLHELVFWMVKCEFPQNMVTLLLGLLPDESYKISFIIAFVQHYSRISTVLASAVDRTVVANRVVHISVQLFSSETLATLMVTKHQLLSTIVSSLAHMLHTILIPSNLAGNTNNRHMVVECEHEVMKEHCYWPIVSDLINVLSHSAVSNSFVKDSGLLTVWMELLMCLQGMNLNQRELSQHVEYEPDTYYAAFSAELEISASPMWSLLGHCTSPTTKDYVVSMIQASIRALEKWFLSIDFKTGNKTNVNQLTFHLPLHRYLAAFLMLGVKEHGMALSSILSGQELVHQVMIHPLQIQVCLPQIYAGLWVRNGIQIKGQAMTYIQCHFCYSMADLDLYLLQVCAILMEPDHFLEVVFDSFQIKEWLSFEHDHKRSTSKRSAESTHELIMLDGVLGFLCALLGIRTYLGISEEELVRLEMATLLCMNDRHHSQLLELMPERSGMSNTGKELFESTLSELSDYKAPSFEAGVGLNQGTYTPKGRVWEQEFDPVHVCHRAIYKKDFQAAMDRYSDCLRSSGKYKGKNSPWPPFKIPGKINPAYQDIYKLLNCPTMHAFLFTVLYKALHEEVNIPESIIYQSVHLLSLCLHYAPKTFPAVTPGASLLVKDGSLHSWFNTTDVKANICEVIEKVELHCCDLPAWEYDLDVLDMNSSSLDEMFNMSRTIPASFGTPVSATQIGKITVLPVKKMSSGKGRKASIAVTTTTYPNIPDSDMVKHNYESLLVTSEHKIAARSYKIIGESLISILIKLHDQLAPSGEVYKQPTIPVEAQPEKEFQPSVVGDRAFFIANFLNHLTVSSTTAARYVSSTCQLLHKQVKANEEETDPRDSKRKKAFSRQQKLMADFASKQKAFMEKAEGHSVDKEQEEIMNEYEEADNSFKTYDCVICSQNVSSTSARPMGIVVFVQSTSVLGHRRQTQATEEITSVPSQEHFNATRCAIICRQHFKQMLACFEEVSVELSLNIGWEDGLSVTTCGHYLHLDCQRSYVESLRNQQPTQMETLSISRGEFYCPLCRQLSNAVIPIIPEEGQKLLVKTISHNPMVMVTDLAEMMYWQPDGVNLLEVRRAMRTVMESFYTTSYKHLYPSSRHDSSTTAFLFICSVLRTNLEMEILWRENTLLQPLSPSFSKKMCILPLLQLLGLQTKVVLDSASQLTQLWSHVTGVPLSQCSSSLSPYKQDVPLFFKDTSALLIQMVLMLPVKMNVEHFLFVVRMLYNVTYMQALVVITCRLTQEERVAGKKKGKTAPLNSIDRWLSFIVEQLSKSPLYEEADSNQTFPAICQSVWSPHSIEAGIQDSCLPFLRVAALLRLHMFGPVIPEVQNQSEFEMLVFYLNLMSNTQSQTVVPEVTGSSCLKWAVAEPEVLVQAWCQHISDFAKIKAALCRYFLNINYKWFRPSLLSLPQRYYQIFTLYQHKTCCRCRHTPKDPAICLVCGAFLCFRENCCMTSSLYECVDHSVFCGAGTGIFLLVNSSTVVVIRGPRATLWGSLYLDQHGEEDRDLKRGRPLYLSQERLQLLETQWLTLTFEHSCKRWIWHRDHL